MVKLVELVYPPVIDDKKLKKSQPMLKMSNRIYI